MEYPDDCITTVRHVASKMATTEGGCYDLKSLGLDRRTTLVLSNTRELDRDPLYKVVYLIYYYQWSVLTTVHPTLNDHV